MGLILEAFLKPRKQREEVYATHLVLGIFYRSLQRFVRCSIIKSIYALQLRFTGQSQVHKLATVL